MQVKIKILFLVTSPGFLINPSSSSSYGLNISAQLCSGWCNFPKVTVDRNKAGVINDPLCQPLSWSAVTDPAVITIFAFIARVSSRQWSTRLSPQHRRQGFSINFEKWGRTQTYGSALWIKKVLFSILYICKTLLLFPVMRIQLAISFTTHLKSIYTGPLFRYQPELIFSQAECNSHKL